MRRTADPKQGYDEYLGLLQLLNAREQVLLEVQEQLQGQGGSELFLGKYNPADFLGADDSSDPRAVLMADELADL